MTRSSLSGVVACLVAVCATVTSSGAEPATGPDTQALAEAAQNPVADLISLPFQNNTFFGIGPGDDVANVLNIQPVLPFSVGDWNVITRTIIPLIYLDDLTSGLPDVPQNFEPGSSFGLGDINFTAFLSPAGASKVTWGIGPSFGLNTATSKRLGTGKWTVGPSAVVLVTPKPWVIGGLVRNLWSFAGQESRRSVNTFLLQPFVNYNMPGGWYGVTSPIVTANWEADSGERWTLPLGGGIGKIFKIGSQAMNGQIQAFGNVVRPTNGPTWSLRFQLQFLFPT